MNYIASNKTDKPLAWTDRLYSLFALHVSKQDVTSKGNKINREREGGKKPLVLRTEPQSQTALQVIQLHEHPLHKNSQQLKYIRLLTVRYSASNCNRSIFHPFVIASMNIKFTTVLEGHHFVSQISLDHAYVRVYAFNIRTKLQLV